MLALRSNNARDCWKTAGGGSSGTASSFFMAVAFVDSFGPPDRCFFGLPRFFGVILVEFRESSLCATLSMFSTDLHLFVFESTFCFLDGVDDAEVGFLSFLFLFAGLAYSNAPSGSPWLRKQRNNSHSTL
jgi:hypothetical protein